MSKSNVKINPASSKKNDISNSDDIKSWGTEKKPNNTSSRCRRGENLLNIKNEWEHQHKIDLKKSGCFSAMLHKPGGIGIARNIGDHMKRDDLRHRMYGPKARVHRMPDYSQDLFRKHFNLKHINKALNPLGFFGKFKQQVTAWHKSDWHFRMAFVEVCLLQPMVWFYVLLFFSGFAFCRTTREYLEVGLCDGGAREDLIEIMSGTNVLNAFLFVFYIQRCYRWFMSQYSLSCSLEGRAFDIVCRARAYISDDSKVMDIYRWTNLIHILGYVGLSKSYTKDNFFIPMTEAYGDLDCGMMSRKERDEFLEKFNIESGGSAYRHAVTEALRVVHRCYKEEIIGMEEARAIESSIVLMRSKMATLYDYAGMPIPVVYKIAVHLSMHVWLITFTLEKAILSEGFQYASRPVFCAICFLGVIMVVFVVVSLFAFSFLVNEPYGDDIFDLPVFSFVNMIAGTTMTIAKDKSKGEVKAVIGGAMVS
jgi:hypothetical protein